MFKSNENSKNQSSKELNKTKGENISPRKKESLKSQKNETFEK